MYIYNMETNYLLIYLTLSLSAFRKLLKTVLFNYGHWLLSTQAVVHDN